MMSFKKTFQAKPVILGPYWRAEQKRVARTSRVRQAGTIVIVMLLGSLVGLAWAFWNSQSATALIYYPNCASARLANAAPINRGTPGYRSALDADDDGVACEPYTGS